MIKETKNLTKSLKIANQNLSDKKNALKLIIKNL